MSALLTAVKAPMFGVAAAIDRVDCIDVRHIEQREQWRELENTYDSLHAASQTIPCIDDRSRSSYMAVSNSNGIAAMTHSNRCISLIDTGTMKRIAEINGLTRTVWTLCFHPSDPNLLATGDLGGRVCVFEKTVNYIQHGAGMIRNVPERASAYNISFFIDVDSMESQWQLPDNIH